MDHNIYINKIDEYFVRISNNILILTPREIRVSRKELLETPLIRAILKCSVIKNAYGETVSSGATRFRVLLNDLQTHLNETHIYSSKMSEYQILKEVLRLVDQYQYKIAIRVRISTAQILSYEN